MNYNDAYKKYDYNISGDNAYATNNQYLGFPPMLSDGRNIVSTYQPISVLDNSLKGNSNNWDYRKYLTHQGDVVRSTIMQKSLNDVGYWQKYISAPNNVPEFKSGPPYTYDSLFNGAQPFGYQSSDLKDIYLSRERLNARLMMPSLSDQKIPS